MEGHGEKIGFSSSLVAESVITVSLQNFPVKLNYSDRLDYWYPAIRFRKEDDVIAPIRKKELADWKNLTLEEKKMCEYRRRNSRLVCDELLIL
ncbi:hypothetical protein ANCCAN_24749 [Ancylostoma caninum]|uniref:Uncharacterized protein n=1 Tax=Ancylostoma caninum TaxID=29170 RepID=A0A368FBJ7_ANCCA|nr:hypothetical protein ANCCAN_24749 [Ancylostoma caninum]